MAYESAPLQITGTLGANTTFDQLLSNVTGFLAGTIVTLCIATFLIGAFFLVISRGKQDQVERGKNLMIGSLIGLAIVLGSYAILRTAFYILY